jgi:ferric-dicitrate binding protein FerR (iron transport regulator)
MNLSDAEILELHELCGALVEDRLTSAQSQSLEQMLAQSEEARVLYFRAITLSNSLAEYAGEMQADAVAAFPKKPLRHWWPVAVLAAAAAIALGFFVRAHFQTFSPDQLALRGESADAELQTNALVARITGTKNCAWNSANQFQPGDAVHRGQQLELKEGTAEITFDCGAQVVLDGPALLSVESAWEAVLRRGGLRATVEPQAAGFRVRHSSVEVLDLGTEFSMVADAEGDAEVKVLKGSVEVSPVGLEEATPAVLHENESRAFGKGRKNRRGDFAKRQARLALVTSLDRWKPEVRYCHWSFDEVSGRGFTAEVFGMGEERRAATRNAMEPVLAEGRWQKALHLNGRLALSASMPGISSVSPRTVAFWLRVPEDAQLSDGRAVIAWQVHSKKSGKHVLEIGWNRDPNQGVLGALRTEMGKNYAVGATSLRDGRWHHVAVVFVPVGKENGPVQVTQYLDGRLEGTTLRAIKNKHAVDNSEDDLMWLGCTPNLRSHLQFRGDLDELFVMDRALSPPEILRLMTQNQPPQNLVVSNP